VAAVVAAMQGCDGCGGCCCGRCCGSGGLRCCCGVAAMQAASGLRWGCDGWRGCDVCGGGVVSAM